METLLTHLDCKYFTQDTCNQLLYKVYLARIGLDPLSPSELPFFIPDKVPTDGQLLQILSTPSFIPQLDLTLLNVTVEI